MNEKQKRHPEGTLVGLSANQQMAESAAKARVDSYLGAFERDHLPPEAYAAAVEAEMELEGSGRAAVRAAANEAWKFRRASP